MIPVGTPLSASANPDHDLKPLPSTHDLTAPLNESDSEKAKSEQENSTKVYNEDHIPISSLQSFNVGRWCSFRYAITYLPSSSSSVHASRGHDVSVHK